MGAVYFRQLSKCFLTVNGYSCRGITLSRLNACWHYERSARVNRKVKSSLFHSSMCHLHGTNCGWPCCGSLFSREAFCKLLSLPLTHDRDYIWDPAHYGYLITRCRNFFRDHGDKEPVDPPPVVFNDRIGPLVNSSGRSIPFAPLLRARTTLPYGIVCSSWTLYQPHALVWHYGYWGTRQEFGRQAGKLINKMPNFQWERIIPPPFLQPWLSFIHHLSTKKGSGNDIDVEIGRLLPLFSCRNYHIPCRVLTETEVTVLSGLEENQ